MTEYVVALDDELTSELEQSIWLAKSLANNDGGIRAEYIVALVSGFKAEIFADEHPPPHFRIKVGSSHANYTIDEFRHINGSGEVLRYEKIVRSWWEENKDVLIETWNERRPSDCPVGRVGEPSRKKKGKRGA